MDFRCHVEKHSEKAVENLSVLKVEKVVRRGKKKRVGFPEKVDADGYFTRDQTERRPDGFGRARIIGRIGFDHEQGPV